MNFSIIILILFLIVNLLLGIRYTKKTNNIEDYAIGGRNFSTFALVATTVATWISGSGFFITISKTYTEGIYYLIVSSGFAIQLILIAYFIVPKMEKFLGAISIADFMGKMYGDKVRFIIALTGSIGSAGLIAVQFKALGNIFSYFFSTPSELGVIFASLIIISYSSMGGIKAITYTDILQFLVFIIALPLIVYLISKQIYSQSTVNFKEVFDTPKFNLYHVLDIHSSEFWQMIPLLLYFMVPSMGPTFTQRITIGRDIIQVKKVFLISGLVLLIIKLVIAIIPFIVFCTNPNLNPNELLGFIIENYTSGIVKILLIISICAMSMSTADSYINSSAVLFSNDICKPLKLFSSNTLLLSRIFAIFLGIISLILALKTNDLLNMVLTMNGLYMPVSSVPVILAILGFKTSTKSILIGMFGGFLCITIWHLLKINLDGIIIAMAVNLIFLLVSHYLIEYKKNNIKKI